MTTIYQNLQSWVTGLNEFHFNPGQFIQENITRSWWLTGWLVLLAAFTLRLVVNQLEVAPISTLLVLLAWAVTVSMVVVAELRRKHTAASLWMKNGLYSSITNAFVTLILVLAILAALRGFYSYAWVNASFETNPAVVAASEFTGANWGAVLANMRTLLVFQFPQDSYWRIYLQLALLGLMAGASTIVYRENFKGPAITRRILTYLWLLSPIISYVLLRGIGDTGPFYAFPSLRQAWGGLLFTMIISVFAIVVSFPIGVMLALGRRSKIPGIPTWLTYSIAIVATTWLLIANTPVILATARGYQEQIIAFWPLLILVIAYLFQRYFKGNVVAAFSTVYIETVRGVPLITVLFMALTLFPIFLPSNIEFLQSWRAIWGFTFFAAAYLAENVRGGLQAIPNGQYEAADSLGLSTFNKYRLIILPQAIRIVIPAIVGQFIGLFKDTTLVIIVGLNDFLGVANLISSQRDWLGVRTEPYIFLMVVYFIGSAAMAGYSRRLESKMGVG